MQTSDGYLWLTTLDGLVRFDGVRFTVFNKFNSKNLPGNRFVDLFAEADDTLWISTEDQGLVRYRNGEFQSFTTVDGLPFNLSGQLKVKPDGHFYALTSDGLARFDADHFTRVSTRNELNQSNWLYASSGTFWEINKDSLSVEKNGQKFVFDLPPEIKTIFSSDYEFNFLVSLFEDRDGVLWISTNSLGKTTISSGRLFKFADGKFSEFFADGMPSSLVSDITQDRHGNLWLATFIDGVCRLSQNKFTCYNAENELATNLIRKFFIDREGTLWFSTEDKGIYRVGEQIITSLSTKQGLAKKNVHPIFEDRAGAIWIGSTGALARYKGGKITNYKFFGLNAQSILEDRDGRLWIGTFNGVYYLENDKFYNAPEILRVKSGTVSIFDIHQDRNGILWFASANGLIRYDGESARLLTTADGLPQNSVNSIVQTGDGYLWFTTLVKQ